MQHICRQIFKWKNFPWLLLFFSFVLLGLSPLRESDSFFYLALARDFFRDGAFPVLDPYILPLEGAKFHAHFEWLGCVLYYVSYLTAGYAGLTLLKIFAAALGWFPALREMWRQKREDSPWHFLLILVGLVAFTLRYSERIALLADVVVIICVYLYLLDWRQFLEGKNLKLYPAVKWAIPIITVFWVNLHGSFPLAYIICSMWLFGFVVIQQWQALWRRVWVLPAIVVISVVNPIGLKGVIFPFSFLKFKREFLTFITMEWNPTFSGSIAPLHEVWFYLVFLILAWILMGLSIWQKRDSKAARFPLTLPILSGIFFTCLGISANRFVGVSVLGLSLVTAFIPLKLTWQPRWLKTAAVVSTAVLIGLILSGKYLKTGLPLQIGFGVESRIFPVKTTQVLKSLPPQGPVWNSFYFGCYLAWELDHSKRIFIHGFATDIAFFQRFMSGIGANKERFDQITKEFNITQMMVAKDPNALDLLRVVLNHPNWKLVSEDEASLLMVKY